MHNLNREDVSEILSESRDFFFKGYTTDIDFRIKQLDKLKESIIRNEKLVLEALYKDLRKSEFEAYETEVGIVLESINYIKKNLKSWAKVKKVKTPIYLLGIKSYIYSEPYGTVLIIGPFNYPFQLVMEPLIGAIAAGNCAVLRPAETTPNVSKAIEKIIEETFDKSYVSVVHGNRETVTSLINSKFDYIFFTGSVPVGKIVMEAAAKNLIPVTLELGGKSPCIVDNTAKLDVAAERIIWGKLMNAGQICVAPDYLLVHKSVKDVLLQKMIEKAKSFYGENAKESVDYGRIVNERQVDRLISIIEKDKNKVAFGGEYDRDDLYISPTLIDNVTFEDASMEDEIFGPILPIITYENIEEVIEIVNGRPKPLALYLFTEDKAIEEKILRNISFGGGCVNETISHVGSPYVPFGGVGNAGIGGYHGKYSFETFSHRKTVMKKSTVINSKLVFPPFNDKVKLVRKLLK